ncbi:MAG: hypothetical protein IK131_03305 [Paludibacteraceae bacterium]|nr:hypothetical protein [Paludibacteraceae bacterium]
MPKKRKETVRKFDPFRLALNIIGWGLAIFLSYYIVDSVFIKGYLRTYQLRKDGVCASAVVTGERSVRLGRHGNTTHLLYMFRVDGLPYEGESSSDHLRKGDSLEIVYLIDNPRINMSNTSVRLKCHD